VEERRWHSNGVELPRGSAAAWGAPAALRMRERERREGGLQLEEHRAMAVLTVNGRGDAVARKKEG
jgi:hypothetical protein